MSQKVVFAGLDVSKAHVDAALWWTGARRRIVVRFERDGAGLERLAAWLTANAVARVGLEASGGYETMVLDALQDRGLEVFRLNAQRVRQLAKAKGVLAKNDRVDALVIAQATAVLIDEDAKAVARDRALDPLRARLTYRDQLMAWVSDCENLLEHERDRSVVARVKRRRAALQGQIRGLEKELAQLIARNPLWRELERRVRTVKGVGAILAHTLIILLPELGKLTPKRIASLVGVAPMDQDSGKRCGERHIAGGRRRVRDVLYMATISAMRHTPPIKALAERLTGKKPKVIIVACMRKLLVTLNAMVRDSVDWGAQRQPA